MGYTFARHETFHIRTGWLRKGLMALEKDDHIFLETVKAMDELGIGKNMISSLRYWLQATKLTKEKYSGGIKIQEKKETAKLILDRDEYFEDPATFWILHFNLARNKEKATTWFWFFNYFSDTEFDQNIFIDRLKMFIKRTGEKLPAISSLKSDFKVFRRMYLYEPNKNSSPENLLESPFTDLKLITETEDDTYKINRPTFENLPPRIFYFCLLESLEETQDFVNVEDVLSKNYWPGKIFKFSINTLYEYLNYLQEIGYVRLDKHAGLNSIKILEKSQYDILDKYYNINKS